MMLHAYRSTARLEEAASQKGRDTNPGIRGLRRTCLGSHDIVWHPDPADLARVGIGHDILRPVQHRPVKLDEPHEHSSNKPEPVFKQQQIVFVSPNGQQCPAAVRDSSLESQFSSDQRGWLLHLLGRIDWELHG